MKPDPAMDLDHCDVSYRTDLSLEAVGILWQELEGRAESSFFLSWHWLGCWLRQTGLTPNLLLIHRGGQLIGLALFQGEGGLARVRHLTSSGSDPFDSVFVEYNGLLVAAHHEAAAIRGLQSFAQANRWLCLSLPGVSAAMLGLWQGSGFAVRMTASRRAPFINFAPLRKAGIGYLQGLSGNCRQQIRRSLRLFAEEGPVVLQVAASLDEALAFFAELIDLHQQSWQARGQNGAFATPFIVRFHRALIAEAWASGCIDLLRLQVGSSVIGCLYNFLYAGDAYAYQSGFAARDDPRCKPGLVCHSLAAERYLAGGVNRYRLLAGESRYKSSLANGDDRLHWLRIRQRGWQGLAADWADRIRSRWK